MALAGCLGGDGDDAGNDPMGAAALRVPLTEPQHAIGAHQEHTFVGTEGTQLFVDWYQPLVPDGQTVPVILEFTPYQGPDLPSESGEGTDPSADAHNKGLVDYYVPRGYAVAFADVRGNHNAGGCIDQTGQEQWQDGYDYVEWLGTQSWSNGKVGMRGASYPGETQFTTAMMQPPHLATIVPVASVSNQYDWNFYNGVPYELQPTIGMGGYLAGSVVPSTNPENAPLYPEKLECQAEAMAAGVDFSGDHTAFWTERDYRGMAGLIDVPTLHVHGLRDWNVRPVHIDPLFNDMTTEKRGIFGQWGHAYPDRDDWKWIENAWYDHHLLGLNNGIMDILPPVLIEDDDAQWWGIDAFPPRDAPEVVLELSADGSLVAPGNADPGEAVLHDYPTEVITDPQVTTVPVQLVGTSLTGHGTHAAWTFVTDQELRLVGRPTLSFEATSSAASTHWVAELTVDGENCAGQAVCQNHAYHDTRHRDGFDSPSDVTPGEAYTMNMVFYPQYDVIPAGSTLRLTLTNNNADITQDPTNSENHVFLGGEVPALLTLPLAPLDQQPLGTDADPLPGVTL